MITSSLRAGVLYVMNSTGTTGSLTSIPIIPLARWGFANPNNIIDGVTGNISTLTDDTGNNYTGVAGVIGDQFVLSGTGMGMYGSLLLNTQLNIPATSGSTIIVIMDEFYNKFKNVNTLNQAGINPLISANGWSNLSMRFTDIGDAADPTLCSVWVKHFGFNVSIPPSTVTSSLLYPNNAITAGAAGKKLMVIMRNAAGTAGVSSGLNAKMDYVDSLTANSISPLFQHYLTNYTFADISGTALGTTSTPAIPINPLEIQEMLIFDSELTDIELQNIYVALAVTYNI